MWDIHGHLVADHFQASAAHPHGLRWWQLIPGSWMVEVAEKKGSWKVLRSLHSHPTGHDLVTWPHLAAQSTGKYGFTSRLPWAQVKAL